MKRKIYLDNAATTKVKKEVVYEMKKYFMEDYGNPSSPHDLGEKAKRAINAARKIFAKEINSNEKEIIFTSGGTESNNLSIQGLARANPNKKKIIISEIEHPSVVEVCSYMQENGDKIIKIPVDKSGLIDLNFLKKKIDKNVLVVSVMHVNNVIGTIQNLSEIGRICRNKKVLFHTDAVQSFGKLDIDVKKMNIDLLSASAHKIGGPKGIGFLYVNEKVKISPLIFGGGQERGLRSGTENVSAIIGFAKALELIKKTKKEKILFLRNKLIDGLEKMGGEINGSRDFRIYNNVHVSFHGTEGDYLVLFLSKKGIYVSSESACKSKKESDDYVLRAVGVKESEIKNSIRITLNEDIKERDVNLFLKEVRNAVNKIGI